MNRVRLIGLGNEWTGDDAAGLKVAQALLPLKTENFDVLVLGVPDYQMFEGLGKDDQLIVVDACKGGGETGSIMKLTLDELSNQYPADLIRHGSSHGLGLQHWLTMAKTLDGISCELLIYGIEIGQLEMGSALSPEVEEAVLTLVAQLEQTYVKAVETSHA